MKKRRNDSADEFEDELVSKSEVKRELKELQDIARDIAEFSDQQLAKLPLNDAVMNAVIEARRIHQHIARKRHLKYLGKLLRELDIEALHQGLDVVRDQDKTANARFHRMEKWRDRLLSEGDGALSSFIDEYPQADRQLLRQLIRNAQKELLENRPPKSARSLFKTIRGVMDGGLFDETDEAAHPDQE